MPSWNIHIAQTQEVLARDCSLTRAVRDQNAFLFGNLVPDIRVGYMVPGIADPIPYRITHFAKPEPIPKPREHEFWDTYVAPLLKGAPVGTPTAATSIVEERERLGVPTLRPSCTAWMVRALSPLVSKRSEIASTVFTTRLVTRTSLR